MSLAIDSRPLMVLRLATAPTQDIGATSQGRLLILRITLETDDGSLIHMTFTGVRDDAHHYFRTVPRFETAAPKYAFLNRLLAVGIGEIRPEGPVHVIEEIL